MSSAPSRNESLTWRASWLVVAKTIGFILSIAFPLLIVRRMNPEQYGTYKQVFLVVASALTELSLGFYMSAFYFLPRYPERRRETVFNIMLFNVAVGGVTCAALCLYPGILTTIFHGPQLAPYSSLIGVTILLWIVGSFLESAPVANQEIKLATVMIVCSQAGRAAIFITAALLYGTVRSLIYAAILFGALQTGALIWYLESRFAGFWRRFDWPMLRGQLAYAVPLGSAALLLTLQNDLHNYFVSYHFGAVMFAIYSIGTFDLPLLALVQEATNSVVITRVAVLQQQNQHRDIVELMARAARKLAAIYFPVYALFIVVGREFIRFIYTDRYVSAWPIFAVYLTMVPANVLLLDSLFRSFASERFFLLKLRTAIISALILTLWLWTGQLGLVGVIAAVVAAGLIERIVTAIHFGRLIGVRRQDVFLLKDIGKLAVASVIAGLATAVLRSFILSAHPFVVLCACGALFGGVYATAVHFLGIVAEDEYDMIRRQIARFLPPGLRYRLSP
jgi:O-antigen/teichoic acid export membrane protein